MAPKFSVKLKANVPTVEYTAAQRASDWRLATGMLRQLLLHALEHHQALHATSPSAATTGADDSSLISNGNGNRIAATALAMVPTPAASEQEAEAAVQTPPHRVEEGGASSPTAMHGNEEASPVDSSGAAEVDGLPFTTGVRGGGEGLHAAMDAALSLGGADEQESPKNLKLYSCEAVSMSVKNLVRHGDAKRLYEDGMLRVLSQYLPVAVDWLRRRMSLEPTMSVKFVAFLWDAFSMALQHLAAVFADLGQGYIIQHTSERSIQGIGVRLFCDGLKRYDSGALQRQFHMGFLALVEADRRGFAVDRRVLETAKSISLEAQVYFSELEPLLVQRTTAFYTALVEELLYIDCVEGDVFFRAVHKRLNDEKDRMLSCCDRKSKALLEEAAQKALLVVHGPQVLAASFAAMAESEETYPAIRLAWKLLSLRYVAKGDAARVSFRDYILSKGGAIVNKPPPAAVVTTATAVGEGGTTRPPANAPPVEDVTITDLIALYTKGQAIVRASFDGMEAFALTLREALQAAIRPKEGRTAEALAKHLDSYLRDGVRKETDEDVERAIDVSMRLFSLIPAKDVFEAFYAELLAKRLVFQRARSLELERLVVRKVKDVVGSSSSMKLEGMLKDLAINEELNQTYLAAVGAYLVSHEHVEAAAQQNAEEAYALAPESPCSPASPSTESRLFPQAFSPLAHAMQRVESKFLILTVGYWPTTFPKLRIYLPKHLQLLSDHFTQFYIGRHGGRRLDWTPTLSTCSVRANFDKGKKDIAMNLLQGVILSFFNDPGVVCLTYEDICRRIHPVDGSDALKQEEVTVGSPSPSSSSGGTAATRLHASHPDLVCALLSISGAPSQRLLLRGSGTASATIDPKETFAVNVGFAHRQVKFRVNQVQLRDPQQDAQVIKEKALSERSHVVDAAIVRYMKSRKRAAHNDLANDVIAMLKFPASTGDVKKRIEVMIEREYLRRDAKDASVYEYVA